MKPIRYYYRDGKKLAIVKIDNCYEDYDVAIQFVKDYLKQNLTVLALVNK